MAEDMRMQARDKVVQKMTRDGLIEENIAQGTMERVSRKTEEKKYHEHTEEQRFEKGGYSRTSYRQSSYWRQSSQSKTAGRKFSRKYTEAEEKKKDLNLKKLERAENRAVRLRGKAERRFREAPKKKRLHFEYERVLNYERFGRLGIPKDSERQLPVREEDFRMVRRLRLKTDEIKAFRYKQPRIRRAIVRKGEHKVFEDEEDNLGLEGAHYGYRTSKRTYRAVRRWRKNYRSKQSRYRRAEKAAQTAEARYRYLKFRQNQQGSPEAEQRTRREAARQMQKKAYQKKYAQKARESARQTEQAVTRVVSAGKAGAKKLAEFFMAHKKMVAVILIIFAVICIFFNILTAVIGSVAEMGGNLLAGTVRADYENQSGIEGEFKRMEAELEYRINHIEEEYPNYDEYCYDLDDIGHDSIVLLSFFGAKYGDFNYNSVSAELLDIFNEMYDLQLVEEVETHHKTVNGEEVDYDYYILNVTLEVKDLKEILENRLETEEQKKQWQIYQESGGGQQIYGNPFDFDWHQNISSQFGYRVHPISGDLKFHSGVDIAASKGTAIHSCMTGTVVSAGWSDSYGYNVVVENAGGYRTKYAHCSRLLVSVGDEVCRGEKIAEVGSTGNSTGNHLHLECISPSGEYLNPLYMVTNFNKEES